MGGGGGNEHDGDCGEVPFGEASPSEAPAATYPAEERPRLSSDDKRELWDEIQKRAKQFQSADADADVAGKILRAILKKHGYEKSADAFARHSPNSRLRPTSNSSS